MTTYAREVDRQPEFPAVPEEVDLVSIDRRPTLVRDGMSIVLTAKRTYFPGASADVDAVALTTHLRAARAAEQKLAALADQPIAPSPLLVAVDSQTPWQRVVDVMDAASSAGLDRALLLFRSSKVRRVPAPGPSAFQAPMQALQHVQEPTRRSNMLADLMDKLVSPCPAVRMLLASAARRGGMAPKKTTDTLLACDCTVDFPSFMTFLWTNRPPDPGTAISLTLTPPESTGERVTIVAAEASLPWLAAHEKVLFAGTNPAKPIRLQVSGKPHMP